jgi:hypothetical protein
MKKRMRLVTVFFLLLAFGAALNGTKKLSAWAQEQTDLPPLRPSQTENLPGQTGPFPSEQPGTGPAEEIVNEPEATDINPQAGESGTVDEGEVRTFDEFAADPFALPPGGRWIVNRQARFTALDKITGKTEPLVIPLDDEVHFGSLEIHPRACLSRPPEETPESAAFVEVTEYNIETNEPRQIFSGWMFASSPALNALEHGIYDVWVTSCTTVSESSVIPAPPKQ